MTEKEKRDLWALYYASAVGWSMHPGYNKPDTHKISLDACADIADGMLERTEDRWATGQQ